MADTATPEDAFSREAGGDAAPAPVPAPGSAAEGGAIEASGPADAPPSPPRSADPGSRRNTLARKLNTLVNNVLDRATPDTEPNTPVMARISMLRVRGAEGELPARLYVPLGAGVGPQPGILFFHGGGFVFGGLDTHDMIC